MWLDTAPARPYVDKLVPFNWRGSDLLRPKATGTDVEYPGRGIELLWDPQQLRIINFNEVNRFVKREYRSGLS